MHNSNLKPSPRRRSAVASLRRKSSESSASLRFKSMFKWFMSFRLTARRILIVACLLILAGYLLMAGSASTEQAFNPDIFSPRRTVVAPVLCLTGYLLIIVGIMRMKH